MIFMTSSTIHTILRINCKRFHTGNRMVTDSIAHLAPNMSFPYISDDCATRQAYAFFARR